MKQDDGCKMLHTAAGSQETLISSTWCHSHGCCLPPSNTPAPQHNRAMNRSSLGLEMCWVGWETSPLVGAHDSCSRKQPWHYSGRQLQGWEQGPGRTCSPESTGVQGRPPLRLRVTSRGATERTGAFQGSPIKREVFQVSGQDSPGHGSRQNRGGERPLRPHPR